MNPSKYLILIGILIIILSMIAVFLINLIVGTKLILIPYLIFVVTIGVILIILGLLGTSTRFINLFIALLSIFITIGLIEGTISIIRVLRPNPSDLDVRYTNVLIDDPLLGKRIIPLNGNSDENGWRNLNANSDVDIVAIGDSQTYGHNVYIPESWPAQLGIILEKDVYSMALGGYGPVQYDTLIEEALSYSPERILIGFYFGNDIADSYLSVYDLDVYKNRRLSTITSSDRLEFDNALSEVDFGVINNLYDELPNVDLSLEYILSLFKYETSIGQLIFGLENPIEGRTLDSYLIKHTIELTEQYPNLVDYYYDSNIFTIFTTGYRLLIENSELAVISEGKRLTLESFSHMQEKLGDTNVTLNIVFIPTKEYAFRNVVSERTKSNTTYIDLIEKEQEMRTWLINYFDGQSIAYIETAPCLELGILEGEEIYPRSVNGHPLAPGYRRIAECIADSLDDLDK